MGLYPELVVALAGWAGGGRVQGLLLKSRSLTQLARPGSTDPDPESNRASRRGLLGEAGGQSGKEAPCGFGSCWHRCQGKRLTCVWHGGGAASTAAEVQQQPFPLGKEGISLCCWHIWWTWCCLGNCCVLQGLPWEVPDAPANHQPSLFSSLAHKTEVLLCLDF